MSGGIRLVRVFGIQIVVQPSWFLILALLTLSLATGVLPAVLAASHAVYWTLALAAALLLFGAVLVHELAHSLVARAQGIPVRSITLLLMGGVASIDQEPAGPGREILVAGAGPLASLAIGGALILFAQVVQAPLALHAMAVYLGYLNIVLAVFNLLPAFPLDGGRLLRAVLWACWRDRGRATAGAAEVGRMFGYALLGMGALLVLAGDLIGGLWTCLVGWMLLQSSRAAGRLSVAESRLEGVPVARLMSRPAAWVPPLVTLDSAAHDYLQARHARCLPVAGAREGEFDGTIRLADLQKVPLGEWDHDRVADVMSPRAETVEMEPGQPATAALRALASGRARLVAVVHGDRLLGLVDQAALSDYVARAELAARLGRRRGPSAGPTGSGGPDGERPTGLAAQ
jgi:Zn-dependent protease